jgi:hypothetical protein
VAGGARNHGIPLANTYARYLKRFLKRYNLDENQIQEIKGGVHTASDLRKTKRKLLKDRYRGNVVIYTSSYQYERRAIGNFVRDFELGIVDLISAEEKILERHRYYSIIREKILTSEFVDNMRTRNMKVDRFPKWLEEVAAYLSRR